MKYNAADLLIQIANRISNASGRISKTILGSMLTDIGDSAVLIKGNQTIENVKTFSNLPLMPDADPSNELHAVSWKYLEKRIGDLAKTIQVAELMLELDVGDSAAVNLDIESNIYLRRLVLYSAADAQNQQEIVNNFDLDIISKSDVNDHNPPFFLSLASQKLVCAKSAQQTSGNQVDIDDDAGDYDVGRLLRIDSSPDNDDPDNWQYDRILAVATPTITTYRDLGDWPANSNVRQCVEIAINRNFYFPQLELHMKNTGAQTCSYMILAEFSNY